MTFRAFEHRRVAPGIGSRERCHLELVVEQAPMAYSLSGSNRVPIAVGPLQFEASAERRGLFGAFDRHVLRWVGSASARLNVLAYNGDVPVGYYGALVSWSASASRANPSSGETFNLDTRSENYSIGASYPVICSRAASLGVRGTLLAYNGSSDITAGENLARDRFRSVRIGLTADLTDSLSGGVNHVEFAKGLSGLGASQQGDPLLGAPRGTNPQFSKTLVTVAPIPHRSRRVQPAPRRHGAGVWRHLAVVRAIQPRR